MEIMSHELLYLYWYGTTVTLPETLGGEQVNVKAMLLQWVCDYRGYPKCFRLSQSPAHVGACFCCDVVGQPGPKTGTHTGKTIYPGSWREVPASTGSRAARLYGPKLNASGPADRPPHQRKTHAYFMAAAVSGDAKLQEGAVFRGPRHPSSSTGAYKR